MKRHLTEGELRAALDGEVEQGQLGHIDSCADCSGRLHRLGQARLRTAQRLSFLAPGLDPLPSVQTAWSRFRGQYLKQKETSIMLRKWFEIPILRVAAVAALALTLLLAFPTTRALAGRLLNLFRVQQVEVLPIDTAGLESLTGDEALGSQLSELISDSTEVTEEPGEPTIVKTAEEAGARAGFEVRLPAKREASNIYVTDQSAFKFTVNREKAQALIDGAGRGDLVLPQEIDGAEIAVSIPAAVSAAYGTCPEPQTEKPDAGHMEGPRNFPDCVIFAQLPSPLVNAPDGVDPAQLAQIGLEFSGMSREEAQAFTQAVDWTSTLVVPIPRNAAAYEDAAVDGVTGKLVRRTAEYAPGYVLIWVKDGIVYAVSGSGTDTAPAFEIAEALP